MGCIVYDVNRDMHHFILERCSWARGLSSSSLSSTNNSKDVILPCSSLVNDFCFAPDSTLQGEQVNIYIELDTCFLEFCATSTIYLRAKLLTLIRLFVCV